jgi:hypothetical protein
MEKHMPEEGLVHSFREEARVSMTYLNRSHPPCLCCWDGAQSQSPPFTFLMSMYLDLVERILVSWSWILCPKLILHFAIADLSGFSRYICWWCFLTLISVKLPVCPM